ncbi:MAG: bifunctional adenosylcobinamide kinase/adenosylcobinamide-phosphate guanylyltransferase, partial [Megasphaera micronuciformis]|nr:bifunctional adenosylcobinamide kinase/adenosylcobinamide-phosphate guanylyltransferase [Megasphaera micronuciformis]
MGTLIVVTGGSRSGKSEFAENLARQRSKKTVYIATAVADDEEMKARVARH